VRRGVENMKMVGELRLVRALTDEQIAAMRDPRLVDVLLEQMGGEPPDCDPGWNPAVTRGVCGATHLGSDASSAAMWQTRLSWRIVIALMRSRAGTAISADGRCAPVA
jgi:hypothetical protein